MSVPLDVRFQRALRMYKPWDKWEFDPTQYPLLGQIQDGQSALLEKSFGQQFYVDFIDLDTLDVCTFPDQEELCIFIGLTRRTVDDLLKLSQDLAVSASVRALIGIPDVTSPLRDFEDILFSLALEFIIAHEAGHYAHGHIIGNAAWFEYSGSVISVDNLRGHADELTADRYAIRQLCGNMLDGDTGPTLAELLKQEGNYGHDQLCALLAISATAVFLLHLIQPRPPINLSKDKHPPIVLRHHRMIEAMQDCLEARSKSATAITDNGHHAVMQAVGKAFSPELWQVWSAQVDVMESPEGKAYLDELNKLNSERPIP